MRIKILLVNSFPTTMTVAVVVDDIMAGHLLLTQKKAQEVDIMLQRAFAQGLLDAYETFCKPATEESNGQESS